MKSVSLLIKPVSGLCNLSCKYCFYKDEMNKREVSSFGKMNEETYTNLLYKFLNIKNLTHLFITFQGGEPTLASIDFYKKFVLKAKELNTNNVEIIYSIQTNTILLDDNWCKFFKDNNFLVGVSLDGIKDTHDAYRIDNDLKGTFDKVIDKINLLKKFEVDFNILTVVNKNTSKNINEIYNFYKSNNLIYQQYIPCLDPLNEDKNQESYSLSVEDYKYFLNNLFNLYYNDIMLGRYIYNREFENYIGILLGNEPESCNMIGHCSITYVAEANGNIYPCDFYSIDKYYLGNINTNTIDEIDKLRFETLFIQESFIIDKKCKECKYNFLCRSGCRRNKEINNKIGLNYYCEAFIDFFDNNYQKLLELTSLVINDLFPRP